MRKVEELCFDDHQYILVHEGGTSNSSDSNCPPAAATLAAGVFNVSMASVANSQTTTAEDETRLLSSI